MAFDPSVISQIPDYAPNPVTAKVNAFKLGDLMNENTLTKMKLAEAKQSQADQSKVKSILQSADLSTAEGRNKAAAEATKVSPQVGMDLMKASQQLESGELQNKYQKLQIADEQQGAIVSTLDPIVQQLDQWKQQGMSPVLLDAKAQQLAINAIQQLSQTRPDLSQALARFAQNPQMMTYSGLKSAEGQSKQGQALIRQHLEEFKSETERRRQEETERRDKAMESNAAKKTSNAEFSDDQRSLLAEMAVRNVNLPAGLRSQSQIKATLDGLIAKNPNKSMGEIADDIKSGKLKLAAETKGAQTAGTQIGKVALSANELDTFGDQTLQASKDIPRGKFVAWNKLSQMTDAQISDPKLLRFKTKMQALENAYNQLAARSGTDVDKRAHIHELFNTANSDEAVQTLVKSLKEEASGAREAANRTIAETSDTSIPGAETPGTAPKDTGGWKIEQVQ